MLEDNRRLLNALKSEREFFLSGGYGRRFRGAWRPTLLFRDSPMCRDNSDASSLNPCGECPLFLLIPRHKRQEAIPCHHIVIHSEGDTIAGLYQTATQVELDRLYLEWLSALIAGLEKKGAA